MRSVRSAIQADKPKRTFRYRPNIGRSGFCHSLSEAAVHTGVLDIGDPAEKRESIDGVITDGL